MSLDSWMVDQFDSCVGHKTSLDPPDILVLVFHPVRLITIIRIETYMLCCFSDSTILSRVISYSTIRGFLATNWDRLIILPIFSLSYRIRLTLGWFALLALVFGSAFGFALPKVEHTTLDSYESYLTLDKGYFLRG